MMRVPKEPRVSASRLSAPVGRALNLLLVLIAAVHAVPILAQSRSSQPPKDGIASASIALRYDLTRHCPELRQTALDDPGAAVVVFRVGPSGVPSQPSIRSSSGSPDLDAAASSCVMRLRFNPRVRAGEGSAMESWQQAAWKWAHPSHPNGTAAAPPPLPAPAVPAPAVPATGAATAAAARPAAASVVRVCVDEGGRLAQDPTLVSSSGDAGFDAAALRIARSGSGYYRAAGASGGATAAGCLQLTLGPDRKPPG
jgi:TonB family protein